MTTKPTPSRFRIRRTNVVPHPAAAARPPSDIGLEAQVPDAMAEETPPAARPPGPDATIGAVAMTEQQGSTEEQLAAIRAEGLTGRQLRMARRVAQRHGIAATSDLDAVRQLRARGIDPFGRSAVLDLVTVDGPQGGRAGLPVAAAAPGLPGPPRPATMPGGFSPPVSGSSEIMQIQRDIARRRQRRMVLLAVRLMIFVLLPTLIVGWYYIRMATPLYATESEFVIQQSDTQAGGPAGLGGIFTGTALATSQDSITVQSYLQSREAMRRLDADHGFIAHWSEERIDPIRRLAPGATLEAAYRLYRRNVNIGYDPSEGVIRMEVIAADPETSALFARALISYAEEQVDQLTQRLREDQMSGADGTYERAEAAMVDAQQRVVELQERFSVLSSEVEVTLLTNQIAALEMELTRDRLQLQELLANPRPNPARVDPLERRIANLEEQIGSLRAGLTQGRAGGGVSLARISAELIIAEANVQTRQLLLAQSLQQLEAARVEANRQVRYLSLGVSPVPPDEATYPRAFENTALAFLIFAGIYLMLAMTAAILREQISA